MAWAFPIVNQNRKEKEREKIFPSNLHRYIGELIICMQPLVVTFEDSSQNLLCFVQVFFCSRTHSQLSQFVGELKRTKYKDSMALAALASRQVGLARDCYG